MLAEMAAAEADGSFAVDAAELGYLEDDDDEEGDDGAGDDHGGDGSVGDTSGSSNAPPPGGGGEIIGVGAPQNIDDLDDSFGRGKEPIQQQHQQPRSEPTNGQYHSALASLLLTQYMHHLISLRLFPFVPTFFSS